MAPIQSICNDWGGWCGRTGSGCRKWDFSGRVCMANGVSIIGSSFGFGDPSASNALFYGVNPVTGERLEPAHLSAAAEDVERAAKLAEMASESYRNLSGQERSVFLRTIADGLQRVSDPLV